MIISKCSADCQYLFFSATYTDACLKFCQSLAPSAFTINIKKSNVMIKQIFQVRMKVEMGKKLQVLKDCYTNLETESSIVFLDTRAEAEAVSKMLIDDGYPVSTLHGDIKGDMRDAIMEQFRNQETKFLVTTNVLARGVDVPSVSVVVNYNVPRKQGGVVDDESYVHRIGRTGRFANKGIAITLLENEEDERALESIENEFNPAERTTVPCDSSKKSILALKQQLRDFKKT